MLWRRLTGLEVRGWGQGPHYFERSYEVVHDGRVFQDKGYLFGGGNSMDILGSI